ncbi:MAG: lysophospholipid acyltransferase family protein [Alphaproteobacteria bacterium]
MTDWLQDRPALQGLGLTDWVRLLLRGVVLGTVVAIGLLLLICLRLVERPLFGLVRPWTPQITRLVSRMAFPILSMGYTVRGQPMVAHGAIVANHSSWIDVFALNAAQCLYFVAKSEVANWAFIGRLARSTGTVFIARKSTESRAQKAVFETRLRAGHRLAFFPEGTSTDGLRVLTFKSTLFAAFYTHGLDHIMQIQPVSVRYLAPVGRDARFYGWWGDMTFAGHLMQVLACKRPGRVEVIFHDPVAVDAFGDRKLLAAHCEHVIRAGLPG